MSLAIASPKPDHVPFRRQVLRILSGAAEILGSAYEPAFPDSILKPGETYTHEIFLDLPESE